MLPPEPTVLGLTVEQFDDISLKVCITGLIVFMVFIIGQLAWESKAGKYGALWLFVGLGLGFVGFVSKEIIISLLGIH